MQLSFSSFNIKHGKQRHRTPFFAMLFDFTITFDCWLFFNWTKKDQHYIVQASVWFHFYPIDKIIIVTNATHSIAMLPSLLTRFESKTKLSSKIIFLSHFIAYHYLSSKTIPQCVRHDMRPQCKRVWKNHWNWPRSKKNHRLCFERTRFDSSKNHFSHFIFAINRLVTVNDEHSAAYISQ